MWNPTHVQVIIRTAKDLKIKGKDGTNNAFVTIDLSHNKFQTTVKTGTKEMVEWLEMCEMKIPKQRMNQNLILTVYHQNLLSVDQFLGTISIPLNRFLDAHNHAQTVTKWYRLTCKPGQTKTDYRGELEVRISFIIKSNECSQSLEGDCRRSLEALSNLSKQNKFKVSTLSLTQPDTARERSATSITNNELKGFKHSQIMRKVTRCNVSLGCNEAESFLNDIKLVDDLDVSAAAAQQNNSTQHQLSLSNHLHFQADKISRCRKPSKEIRERFHGLHKDNLIDIIVGFHGKIETHKKREMELEEYIDSLVLKVLDTAPDILQNNDTVNDKDNDESVGTDKSRTL